MNYDFSEQIRQITKRTKARIENVAEKIALEVARRIIMATPVDTGALRGNWFPSYETPDVSYDEGLKDPSGTATVAQNVTPSPRNDHGAFSVSASSASARPKNQFAILIFLLFSPISAYWVTLVFRK